MKRSVIAAGALGACLLLPMGASAQQQASTPMDISANVVAAVCSIDPIAAVDFGDVLDNIAGVAAVSAFEVTVQCDQGLSYKLGIDAGQNLDPNVGRRLADGNGSFIGYSIFQPDPQLEWGDQDLLNPTYSAPTIAGTGDGTSQSYQGEVDLDFALAAPTNTGLHTDTVNVIVEY